MNLVERATVLIDAADDREVPLRLVGSVGFRVLSEQPELHAETFDRALGDIDLVGRRKDGEAIQALFEEFGYDIDVDLLLAGWGDRFVFYAEDHEVDVFLGKIKMCHTIDLTDRLEVGPNPYVLSPADLFLEKTQIIEINEKDLKDLIVLFLELPLTRDETGINQEYIAGVLGDDWGFYHTVTMNLRKLARYVDRAPLTDDQRETVTNRVETLEQYIEAAPKSLGWKARSKVGERVKWYNAVEEKHR